MTSGKVVVGGWGTPALKHAKTAVRMCRPEIYGEEEEKRLDKDKDKDKDKDTKTQHNTIHNILGLIFILRLLY